MTTLFQSILVISLACIGVKILFEDGMILSKLGVFFQSYLPLWVCKPLFLCSSCMASVWGGSFYFIFFKFDLQLFIVVILGVCTINTILWNSMNLIWDIKDVLKLFLEYENETERASETEA